MKIYLTTKVEEWQGIRREWNDLLSNSMDCLNPFLSFEWLFSWWEVFGNGKKLRILIARKDGELVGIAPLMISWKMGFRVCEFIGTGRSDYLGFIIEKENREETLEEFFRFISKKLKWDLLYLRDYTDSPQDLLRIAKAQGLRATSIVGDIAPRLLMNGCWEHYLAGKSRKHRGNIKRLIKNIEKDVNITVECVRNYTPGIVDELADVEARSWKAKKGDCRFYGRGNDFFHAFFPEFSKNGWLRIWILRHRQKLLAYNVNFVLGKATYFYNVSFDSDAKNYTKHSVGSAVTAFALRDSFQRGHKIYDFLRGEEVYKMLWTNDKKQLAYIALYKRNLFSIIAFLLHYKFRLYLRGNKTVKRVHRRLKKRRSFN